MYRCWLITFLIGATISLVAQNPHGEGLKMDCAACHTSDGWEIAMDSWHFIKGPKIEISQITGWALKWDTLTKFNHFNTNFPLEGQHAGVDCRGCHADLVFAPTSVDCISCHTDVHQQTVGSDCVRCHTADNWLVDNITDLHLENGFPLLGMHATAACIECHTSETGLQFTRIGNECINCHLVDFNATTNPNHADAGFSMECVDCHSIESIGWFSETMNHDFFPLTKGHAIEDCAACHIDRNFINTPTDCFACHQSDFTAALDPNHAAAGFSTECIDCHTTDIGWEPAEYADHDNIFPIYSGAHQGEWEQCVDCHNTPSDYTQFTCTNCHTNPETDEQHAAVTGYVYENTACLACHPAGNADDVFDHDKTNFPLTGAHIEVECLSCHSTGYAGTPTDCAACHHKDFEQTINPNHKVLNLSTDCVSCHTTEPDWMPARFDNHDDFYPLNGAHAAIANDCAACHNGDYNNTPNTCIGCHQLDFDNTTEPNHKTAGFPTDCTICHTETAWEPATFDHDQTNFPLRGAHITTDCIECHADGYAGTPTDCVACHQQDFDQTTDPNHKVSGFSTDCIACHSETAWLPATFDHDLTAFPLTGVHATTNCIECHENGYTGTPTDCAACHQLDFDQTINPNHKILNLSTDCVSCHISDATSWIPATFDNHHEFYELKGTHAAIANDCVDCHNGDYNNTPNTCIGCHQQDFDNTTDPDHKAAKFPLACESCHSETAWTPSTFNHDQYYPLTGGHKVIENDCVACHQGDYDNTPTTCVGCHTQDFEETVNPNHRVLNLTTDCESCHTTEPDWMPARFDIHDQFYRLNGVHAAIANDCVACHNGDYNNTPNTCFGCHATDFNNTTDPNHKASGFSTNCIECHSETAWEPATFDHDQTDFPLRGAHATTDCIECHADGYVGTPTDCVACHQADFDQTTDPNHKDAGFPTDCTICHNESDWETAIFDHDQTDFPLRGAHVTTDCIECHTDGYVGTPTDCVACHQSDFDQTTDPNHKDAGFPTDCTICHTETDWETAIFDHDQTNFPLRGAHATTDCIECHADGYVGTPTDCVACHQSDFDQTTDPNHKDAGFPTDCTICHTETDWETAIFDHDQTDFPLRGAHATTDCIECHADGYVGTPTDCVACHQSDFDQTTDPNHKDAGFPTDCTICHNESDWETAIFDHDQTDFPLRGAHATTDCIECHADGYVGTPTDCVACHQSDFDQTTDPNHKDAGFPTDCKACHTEGAWIPATFDHDQTNFPLRGAHATTDCIECHADGYAGTPTDCFACHQSDYNNARNPNHLQAGFPTDCTECHSEIGWEPSTFDHDAMYFPIYSGNHQNEWTLCSECHINNDFNSFSCIDCHEHNDPNQLRNDHDGVNGYRFESNACFECHPNGNSD